MRADSAPVEPAAHSGCREETGHVVIHMVTPTVTGASRGALGAGLEMQDWLLCVDGCPRSGALCDSRGPKDEEGAPSQKGLGSV